MTTERDAELSALLDGALAAHEETALRAELARDAMLAARFEELARVDAALRAIPARPVPANLRARLQAKLEAEAAVRPELTAIRGGAPARRPRMLSRAWAAGLAAAAAAAVVAVIGLPRSQAPSPSPGESLATTEAPARALPPAPERAPAPQPGPSEEPIPVSEIAAQSTDPEALESVPLDDLLAEPRIDEPSGDLAANEIPEPAEVERLVEPGLEVTSEPAVRIAAAEEAPVRLLVEVTDDEADALGELDPNDADMVALLDVLDALGALEAEAS